MLVKRRVAVRKQAIIQHLDAGKIYRAHFGCNCLRRHDPWTAYVRVDKVTYKEEPSAELTILHSEGPSISGGFRFSIKERNDQWTAGVDGDPVHFSAVPQPRDKENQKEQTIEEKLGGRFAYTADMNSDADEFSYNGNDDASSGDGEGEDPGIIKEAVDPMDQTQVSNEDDNGDGVPVRAFRRFRS